MLEGPSTLSKNRVTSGRTPVVETYVRRSNWLFEILVLSEIGGQVKEVCGGSAYEVISLDADI